ncbi:alpha/beta hydrolase [Legionella sp.]|uniref:alpha/beta hydrolase n=1 Tax=Legionella sp. TaxID=459 RepID=UPI003C9CD74E
MQLTDKLAIPGEHPLVLQGLAGQLEAVLTVPEATNSEYAAFLGHPHSLQGGTMTNKVVTTMARTFKDLGIPSLRFNFRGVGQSAGIYDAGIGESEDMLSLVHDWQRGQPQAKIIFAGFSFGSFVAYRAASQCAHSLLLTIAPALHHYNYKEFNPAPHPWLIIQGDEDEVVPPELVFAFAKQSQPEIPVIRFAQTTHFFHGKLIELKTKLSEYIVAQVISK